MSAGLGMASGNPISLWDKSAAEPDHNAPPSEQTDVDVAIVGGGFTGLSTALHCAEAGLSAHVLEAERIGHGGSGRNAGLVNAGVWYPPAKVRKALGSTYGPRFVERFGDAPEYVFSLIERHQIQCEPTRTGTVHAAHAPSGFRDLESRHAEWSRLGAPVELLDRSGAARATGSEKFFGGLLDKRAGTINPMGYCRGLARAARGAGAAISTGVTVRKLRREGGRWIVETDAAPLRAKAVVLGTNAYTDDLWPGLKRIFTIIHYFQLATEPLGERALRILPDRQGLWTTAPIMLSMRRDMSDRLVIGSMGTLFGSADKGLSRRWAARRLRHLFPDLGPVGFEEAWYGRIALTPDHLPRIHKLDENLYTPIGYNGRGITTGTVFGQAMSQLLTGMDPAELPLPMTDMSTAYSAPVMSRLYEAAFTANQIAKSL